MRLLFVYLVVFYIRITHAFSIKLRSLPLANPGSNGMGSQSDEQKSKRLFVDSFPGKVDASSFHSLRRRMSVSKDPNPSPGIPIIIPDARIALEVIPSSSKIDARDFHEFLRYADVHIREMQGGRGEWTHVVPPFKLDLYGLTLRAIPTVGNFLTFGEMIDLVRGLQIYERQMSAATELQIRIFSDGEVLGVGRFANYRFEEVVSTEYTAKRSNDELAKRITDRSENLESSSLAAQFLQDSAPEVSDRRKVTLKAVRTISRKGLITPGSRATRNAIPIPIPYSDGLSLNVYLMPRPQMVESNFKSLFDAADSVVTDLQIKYGSERTIEIFQTEESGLALKINEQSKKTLSLGDLSHTITGLKLLLAQQHPKNLFIFDIFRSVVHLGYGEVVPEQPGTDEKLVKILPSTSDAMKSLVVN